MTELRNIELSVDLRIWHLLRLTGWVTPVTGMVLNSVGGGESGLPDFTYSVDDGFPWVFLNDYSEAVRTVAFDSSFAGEFNGPHSSVIVDPNVKIYDGPRQLESSEYRVDYLNGRVYLDGPALGEVKADALVSAVKVREGYPDEDWLKKNDIPCVAWSNTIADGKSFAIGTILEDRTFYFSVDILGSSRGECSDLLSDIMRYIVKVPMVDFRTHQPVLSDGTLDPEFSFSSQFVEHLRMTRRPRGERIPPRQGGLDKERHRAMVAFQVQRIS